MSRFADPIRAPQAKKPPAPAAKQPPKPSRTSLQHRVAMVAVIQRRPAERATAEKDTKTPSRGGLPARLRAGIEALSGLFMGDVQVHRNSAEPEKLGALAYAKGSDIHLGPGQERHLPHEAWHVVQQKEGRVPVTAQVKGAAINQDVGLEAEADRMAAIAERRPLAGMETASEKSVTGEPVVQRQEKGKKEKVGNKKKKKKAKKSEKKKPSYLSYDEIKKLVSSNNKSGQSDQLIIAQIWKETKFEPSQVTGTHVGLMQIYRAALIDVNKNFGTTYKYSSMTDPAENIQAGTLYLKLRIRWKGGNVTDGLNGFGTGSGYADNILKAETALKAAPADPVAELTRIIGPQ